MYDALTLRVCHCTLNICLTCERTSWPTFAWHENAAVRRIMQFRFLKRVHERDEDDYDRHLVSKIMFFLHIRSLFDNKIPSVPQKMVKGLENLEEL